MSSRNFSVVLPAYNEAPGLETLIWRIVRSLHGRDYEIIVVDDGSSDETAAIAASLAHHDLVPLHLIRHEKNRGYGAAIRTGILAARERASVVVTMDADDSHDPGLIPLMLDGLACGSDVIVASRFVPGGREIGVPLHRKVLSRGAGFVFGRVLNIDGVRDYTCGYRAYRSEFVNELVEVFGEDGFAHEAGFTVGVELMLKADRIHGRLGEVPLVLRYDRKRSESKLRIGRTLAEYGRLLRQVRNEKVRERGGRPSPASGPRSEGTTATIATIASDVAAVVLAFAMSFIAYRTMIAMDLLPSDPPAALPYAGLTAMFSTILVLTFWRFGLYAPRLSMLHLGHLLRVSEALTTAVAVFFAALFFAGLPFVSRMFVLGAIVASYPVVLTMRGGMTSWLRLRRRRKSALQRVLIYGAGETGLLLAKKIAEAPRLGAEVVGFLDDRRPVGSVVWFRTSQIDPSRANVPVLGALGDLARVVAETGAGELYVTIPDLAEAQLGAIRAEAEQLGLELAIVPRIGATRADQVEVDDIGAIPLLRLHRDAPRLVYQVAKRVLDIGIVLALVPFVLPLALVTSCAIAVDGRPILFRQTRIGRNGRPFTVWKFRTMRPDVEPYADSPGSNADPRITPIGRLVRMAGIDELPQLLNVLRGEMSIVGPRPEMPHIAARYGELERRRLSVPPGITGLWQLSPDRSQAIHENMEYDLLYLRQRRLSFDLLIIGQTVLFAFQAFRRSVVEAVNELGWRRVRDIDWRLFRGAPEESQAYVLMALDQRRRPDEPTSWTTYLPQATSLAQNCMVKLVVAERNASRIRELTSPDPESRYDLEYVRHTEWGEVHDMAVNARVVVTDLDFVADRARSRGVSVLQLADGVLRCDPISESSLVLMDVVLRTFEVTGGRLRFAN